MIDIIAHRAGKSLYGENTIKSAKKSIELGCDYIEIDIRQTKDNKFIVHHLNNINNKLIRNINYAELKKLNKDINQLEDFLFLIKNNINTKLLLDIKDKVNYDLLYKKLNIFLKENKIAFIANNLEIIFELLYYFKDCDITYILPKLNINNILELKKYKTIKKIAIGDKTSNPTKFLITIIKSLDFKIWAFTINEKKTC